MVTLYNYKPVQYGDKPLIKNIQFKKLCKRLDDGDLEAYEKALKHFSLVARQKSLLETIYNEVKLKKSCPK